MNNEKIKIGTLAPGNDNTHEYIRKILPLGFESFSITFGQTLADCDLKKMARQCREVLSGSDAVISSIGIYGNPLVDNDQALQNYWGWESLIDAAQLFGCDLVTGFTGRVTDKPIAKSYDKFCKIFTPLVKRAEKRSVRLAFENCDMGGDWWRGDWNIAHNPTAWEMIFNALNADHVGLEWEPCHQLVSLIDPIPQLRKWVKKIFHVHGKDANVHWDVIREFGIHGPKKFACHRTAGFGDSDWTQIIAELKSGGFVGSIDIEGWHDPVYKDSLEMAGQTHALQYLKNCRKVTPNSQSENPENP
ncbi:MAG: sugar phosphate isomerase/epimerase [Sedimentisphaerales bacterium]|nr:sugar phosphate isomerase/epimerase [Sedimentisphaerales bacterium]